MSDVERMTVTLTHEMAELVRGAVGRGDYASSSEVIREALRDWRRKRHDQRQALEEMRALIAEGLEDAAAGRVREFDVEDIIAEGRRRLRGGSD